MSMSPHYYTWNDAVRNARRRLLRASVNVVRIHRLQRKSKGRSRLLSFTFNHFFILFFIRFFFISIQLFIIPLYSAIIAITFPFHYLISDPSFNFSTRIIIQKPN